MENVEFAPKARVVTGRIATKSEIKSADNSKWDYDAIVLEVRDSSAKAHQLRFIESFAISFNFAADLFIGNIITADVEDCVANVTQYLDENGKPEFHLFDHTRVVSLRSATEDEVVGFLSTVITKTEMATLNELYKSIDVAVDPVALIAAARTSATPLIVAAKDSIMAERKSYAEAYNKLHTSNVSSSEHSREEIKALRIEQLKAKRDALAEAGAQSALLASYDRKISAYELA